MNEAMSTKFKPNNVTDKFAVILINVGQMPTN